MKKQTFFIGVLCCVSSLCLPAFGATQTVMLKTEKIGDAVHWTPKVVEVTAGEKVRFVVKHELEGGFDFHGFFIPVLKLSEQVNRHKAIKRELTIPKDLKPGDYEIGCQFHPKHVAAKLVVKAPKK